MKNPNPILGPVTPVHCPEPDCSWSAHGIPDKYAQSRARHLAEHQAKEHGATQNSTPDPLSPEREAEIRSRRYNEVTPGPWLVSDEQDGRALVYVERQTAEGQTYASVLLVADWATEADVQFVASTRRSVPELLAALDEVRAERDELKKRVADARKAAIEDVGAWLARIGEEGAAYIVRTCDIPEGGDR